MQNFTGFNTLEDLVTKTAEAELLLSHVLVSPEGVTIHPVKCPAVGRKEDFLKDSSSQPACSFQKQKCKYFMGAEFNLEGYTKKIMCSVM